VSSASGALPHTPMSETIIAASKGFAMCIAFCSKLKFDIGA
jgi:hypothetical protein